MLASSSTTRNNQETLSRLQDPMFTKPLHAVNNKVKLMAPQPIADCPTIKDLIREVEEGLKTFQNQFKIKAIK
eukprot:3187599-Ditylum_brightwellii.AAC.1